MSIEYCNRRASRSWKKYNRKKTGKRAWLYLCRYRCNVPRHGILFFTERISPLRMKTKIAEACPNVDVTIAYENGEQQVILNGENVNGFIRTEEVGNMASATSVYPVVRTKLVELQRKLAESTECDHGWKRYRNVRASECAGEDLSDRKL